MEFKPRGQERRSSCFPAQRDNCITLTEMNFASPRRGAPCGFTAISGAGIVVRCRLIDTLMKKLLAIFILTLAGFQVFPQSRAALEGDYNLQDRYELMKDKAETFNEYKVIRRDILDGVWRIAMDSLQKEKAARTKANATITQLRAEVSGAEQKVKQADASVAASDYERSHLAVLGIPMAKTFFVTAMFVLVIGLLIGLLTILASLKVLRKSVKEKETTIYSLTSEFDEYRKKALQKEMKISRELQDERNKLAAMMKA
jgi:hypothetical protein